MMKRILSILAMTLLMAACGGVSEEVITTYDNGQPELALLVQGKDDARQVVGERRYFSNGVRHYEIHFADDQQTPKGVWEYNYPSGAPFARAEYRSGQATWQFFADGERNAFLNDDYDSVVAAIVSERHLPVEVHAFKGDSTWVFRFYEDFLQQSQGTMVHGLREGLWKFYYPNGQLQTESYFAGGVENGKYNCYRENGIPYYMGFYINGQRAHIWEFYDMEGNLSGRKNFDEQ